jgi:hypothetical protein
MDDLGLCKEWFGRRIVEGSRPNWSKKIGRLIVGI